MQIIYLPKFERAFKRLPESVKDKFDRIEPILRENPFDSRLRIHKLRGEFSGLWAFSVGSKHRVICEFADIGTLVLFTIGTHDVYR